MKPSLAKTIHNSHRTAGRRHDDRSRGAVPIDRRRDAANEGNPGIASALVLAGDRLFAEWIQQEVAEVFPEMRLTSVSSREKAEEALSNHSFDLLLVLLDQLRGAAFELLARYAPDPRQSGRVILVTARHNPQTLSMLRLLSIEGVVDPQADGLAELAAALRTVAKGGQYWSRAFLDRVTRAQPSDVMHRMLTHVERLVIGIIGDGCDDDTAAHPLVQWCTGSLRVAARLQGRDQGESPDRALWLGDGGGGNPATGLHHGWPDAGTAVGSCPARETGGAQSRQA